MEMENLMNDKQGDCEFMQSHVCIEEIKRRKDRDLMYMSASSLGYSMYAGSFSLLKKSFRTGTNSWHSSHSADAKNSIRMRFSRIPTISRSVLSSSWSQLFSTRTRFRNRSTMMEERDGKGPLWRRDGEI